MHVWFAFDALQGVPDFYAQAQRDSENAVLTTSFIAARKDAELPTFRAARSLPAIAPAERSAHRCLPYGWPIGWPTSAEMQKPRRTAGSADLAPTGFEPVLPP